MSMTSSRPYLVRALYEWILDNRCTPYALVDANFTGVQVPQNFVKDGRIVLNLSPGATSGLLVGDELLTCNARFGGVPMELRVPMGALLGIYAKENGRGMMFDAEPEQPEPAPVGPAPVRASSPSKAAAGKAATKAARPSLKVVK